MRKADLTTRTTRTHIEYDLPELRKLFAVPKEATDFSIESDFDKLRVYYTVTTYPSE